jgi:agmatinase
MFIAGRPVEPPGIAFRRLVPPEDGPSAGRVEGDPTATVKTKKFAVLGPEGNFLGVDAFCGWEESRIVVLQAPLDVTTSYVKGTGDGPKALIAASRQVEYYDDELKVETCRRGIATLPPLRFKGDDPEPAVRQIEKTTAELLAADKRVALVGGEHTVTVGAVRAYKAHFPDLTVLHLDAHADLRESYEGSPYSHACVMARVREVCPTVSVGIRAYSQEEANTMEREGLAIFDIHSMRRDEKWMDKAIERLGETVYVTFDLDALDPSIMPAVGTPEPGGMHWDETIRFLRRVFREKVVVGMDLVELCPRPGAEYGEFAAAKLFYRMIGYWTTSENSRSEQAGA